MEDAPTVCSGQRNGGGNGERDCESHAGAAGGISQGLREARFWGWWGFEDWRQRGVLFIRMVVSVEWLEEFNGESGAANWMIT